MVGSSSIVRQPTVHVSSTRICCVGLLRISAWQIADVCEPFAESSQVIHGNIAGYSQNLRTMPAEPSAEGLPQNV